ncbi:MAG: hypothetical protein KJO54_07115 [Gammaproteobacteria bacterium]|nr:hypothetical protein [Gammaproteobacteria bacterium]
MSDRDASIREQLRRNAVALISLVVAISSLGYNTWRNEQTEANRNVRSAGFQLMQEIAGLQQVVLLSHYDMDDERGNPRVGWTHVIAIRDLAYPMPAAVQESAAELYLVWQQNWATLAGSADSLAAIDAAIEQAKKEILAAIDSLD